MQISTPSESRIGEPALESAGGASVPAGSALDLEPTVESRTARLRRSMRHWSIAVGAAIAIVVAGQVVEDLGDTNPLQMLAPDLAMPRWTVIVAVVYALLISRLVDRLVDRSLHHLRTALRTPPEEIDGLAERLRRPRAAVDAALLVAAGAIVVVLFVGLRTSLPIKDSVTAAELFLPTAILPAAIVLAEYAVVGWAIVDLAYVTVRRAWALGAISRQPLMVDVFDTTNLLPLGNIALGTALAPAGIIVILLVGFGRPTSPVSWTVLALAMAASVLALILPLRGIHAQMIGTKRLVLSDLNRRLREINELVDHGAPVDDAEAGRLSSQTNILTSLRKTVQEMPTWPFRDSLAFGRALLIASAPLIYTVMSEVIKAVWIAPLSH
jgi:hypothetical protein